MEEYSGLVRDRKKKLEDHRLLNKQEELNKKNRRPSVVELESQKKGTELLAEWESKKKRESR